MARVQKFHKAFHDYAMPPIMLRRLRSQSNHYIRSRTAISRFQKAALEAGLGWYATLELQPTGAQMNGSTLILQLQKMARPDDEVFLIVEDGAMRDGTSIFAESSHQSSRHWYRG